MKIFFLAASALAFGASAEPYSTRMIRSIMGRRQGVVSSGAATSTLESGILALSLEAWLRQYPADPAGQQIADYLHEVLDVVVPSVSNASAAASGLPLDRLSVGQALHALEPRLSDAESASLASLNTSLAEQRRNADGGFWYYVYPDWSYLDGAVSFLPFLAAEPGWRPAEMLRQIELLHDHCQDPSGLLVHGYDDSRTAVWANPDTGASPFVWGRSLGWYLAGLVNAWEVLQSRGYVQGDDDKLRSSIRSQTAALAAALVPLADVDTGAWWQLPTFPGREDNFLESSSTALFVFSLLKGARLGLVPHGGNETAAALRAYDYTLHHFVARRDNGTDLGYDGTVAVCSLNSTATYDYYTSRPTVPDSLLGEAAFVLASLEVERGGY